MPRHTLGHERDLELGHARDLLGHEKDLENHGRERAPARTRRTVARAHRRRSCPRSGGERHFARLSGLVALCLAPILVVSAALASSAAAVPLWLLCLKGGTGTKYEDNSCTKAKAGGEWGSEAIGNRSDTVKLQAFTLELTDTKTVVGVTTVRCSHPTVWWGLIFNTNLLLTKVVKVENPKTECAAVTGGCKAGEVEAVEGVHLPWKSELFETEGKILSKIMSESPGSGKEPGWKIRCNTLLGAQEDVCESTASKGPEETEGGSGGPNVVSGGVLLARAIFRNRSKGTCKLGGAESAELRGLVAILLWNGQGLSVHGAGGGGGEEATSTTLTTTLSGESKEGGEITVLEGAKVKDKAKLSGTNASKATGTVKYAVYSDNKCEKLVKSAGEVNVSGESVPVSEEKELEAGKTYYWQASYSGDSKNKGSTSTCGSEVSNVKAKTTLATSLKDEEHSGETLEANEELSVSDTATLSGTNSSTAAGTVTYNVYSEKECKTLEAEAGKVTVASGIVPASTEDTLPAGTYYWQATYSGDALHQESKSSCGKEIETVKATAALATSLSGEGQTSNRIEVVEGTLIKDQATLTGLDASKATGKVKYKIYSEKECKTLVAEAGEVTVSGETVPASKEEKLKAGTFYWQATYSGDSNNAGATTTCGEEVSVVDASTTLATSLSGGGQEGESISVPEGTKITDKATLSGTDASKATGDVEYNVYSESECKTLVASAGEVSVTSGSIPASSEQTLAPGTYYWQADYTGDGTNHGSVSSCKEVAVVKATTALATSLSGGGQSHEAISVLEGTAISDHATLSGVDASKATGTVKYKIYSDKECKTLVAEAGEATVSGETVPASKEEKLKAGTYYWQATYSGDSNNEGSSSTCGKELAVVRKTLLATSLSGEGQSGKEIKVADGAVHDTATLSGENAPMATGTVKYDVYSDSACKTLVAEAGEVTVTGGLVPESKAETLSAGTYYWQATYSGDSHNEGSTTPCDEETSIIGPTAPQVEQVTFTNDMPVIVDNQHNNIPETAEAIEEYTGHDNVDWEYAPAHKELIKSWPLAYAKETTADVRARFELPSSMSKLILEKRIEGKPTITGSTTLNGEAITFTKEFASAEALETQVKKHESYIEIGESPGESPIVASKALPAKVGYESMAIEWTWTVKLTGTSSSVKQSLGTSTSELYLTFGEPSVAPCKTVAEAESVKFPKGEEVEEETEKKLSPCTPMYFSALYQSVTNVEKIKPTEAEDIARIWRGFSNFRLLPVALRLNNPAIPVPTIERPRWRAAGGNFGAPIIFKYYAPVAANQNVAAFAPLATGGWAALGGCTTVFPMLADGTGRCGAFAEWLVDQLAQNRVATNLVHLDVSYGAGAQPCNQNEPEVCMMLVKNWGFAARGTSGDATFPFRNTEVTDQVGAAGQGVENPPPYFWDHAIVKAGGGPGNAPRELFDPSYGVSVGGATPAARLAAYQNAAIAGFCRPTNLVNNPVGTTLAQAKGKLPMKCAQVGAATRLGVIP